MTDAHILQLLAEPVALNIHLTASDGMLLVNALETFQPDAQDDQLRLSVLLAYLYDKLRENGQGHLVGGARA